VWNLQQLINLVYESLGKVDLNFINCPDINESGIKRFTSSPFSSHLETLSSKHNLHFERSTKPLVYPYIIPSGVGHSPDIWTGDWGKYTKTKHSVFYWLSENYLNDLRNNRAYLLLDQSHEGYQTEWLWDWFHFNCKNYSISPSRIIYVTGNLMSEDQYNTYALQNGITEKLTVVGYPHFEMAMSVIADTKLPPTFKDQKRFKSQFIDKIYLYNCLQKRPRNHRAWMFDSLYHANLLDDGINSMNLFEYHKSYMEGKTISKSSYDQYLHCLPMLPPTDTLEKLSEFQSHDCGSYLENFNNDITLNSWLSVISEASFSDRELTCFISEKTFKTIASNHPFIIFGNKHSLKYLRSLGYQTFHPLINEEYDELETWGRLSAIITELNRLKNMSNEKRLIWYQKMKPILLHNRSVLSSSKDAITPAIEKFLAKIQYV